MIKEPKYQVGDLVYYAINGEVFQNEIDEIILELVNKEYKWCYRFFDKYGEDWDVVTEDCVCTEEEDTPNITLKAEIHTAQSKIDKKLSEIEEQKKIIEEIQENLKKIEK